MGEEVTGEDDEGNHFQSWKRETPTTYFELSPGGGDNSSSVVMPSS